MSSTCLGNGYGDKKKKTIGSEEKKKQKGKKQLVETKKEGKYWEDKAAL